jgi:hypothetical protein
MVFVIRVDSNNRTGGPPKKTFFAEAVDGALAALDALGIRAQFRWPPPGVVRDSVRADGPPAGGRLHRRPSVEDVREVASYRAGQVAARLLRRGGPSVNTLPLLVADSVTAQGRTLLTDAGWSWFDRRGQLHLRAPRSAGTAAPTSDGLDRRARPSEGARGSPLPTGCVPTRRAVCLRTDTLPACVSPRRPSPPQRGTSPRRVWSTTSGLPSPGPLMGVGGRVAHRANLASPPPSEASCTD